MKCRFIARALNFRLIPVVAALAGMSGRLSAQSIALYTDSMSQSAVYVEATFDNDGDNSVNNNVTSLPYTTVATTTDTSVTSTVTPNVSTSSLSFMFSQSVADNKSLANGEGTIFFTALVNATYSISGGVTATGPGKTGAELSAFLQQVGMSGYLYQYDLVQGGAVGSTSATLDNSFGYSLTGSLVAGDVYEFDAFDTNEKEGAQTLTGTTTITITPTPEPSTWAIMLGGAGMLAGFNRFARKNKAAQA